MTKINLHANVITYQEEIFNAIMMIAQVNPIDVMNSLHAELNRRNVFKAGEGSGASGSFFFFSADNRFIIKTLRGNEKDILLEMLNSFISHLVIQGGRSMIAKIFGLFTLKSKLFAPLDFIIMENVTRMDNKANHRVTFDLKGSIRHRKVNLKTRFWNK